MRIFELEQPKSAEQFKLDQLQAVNKRASLAVKNEREKQKLQHANKALQQLHKPKAATVVPNKTIKPIKAGPPKLIKPSLNQNHKACHKPMAGSVSGLEELMYVPGMSSKAMA